MAEQAILSEVKGHVGTITFNRPERRNALSPDMLIGLHLILEKWAEGTEVRCVVVTGGTGKAFCSGYDISAIPTEMSPEMEKVIREHNPLELAFTSMKNFPYPTIAMWNGYCFGAGLNLSMVCDIRTASDTVKLGMPPAKLGLVYHPDGLIEFVQAAGFAATRELFFSGRTISAKLAKEMGLVNHVLPAEELAAFTYELAEEIAGNAPISLKNTKKILNMLEKSFLLSDADRKQAEVLQAEGFASEDLKEGQMAFLEKRKPVFKGR
ncbi:MAG: enoyl-CoA hydratase-related protein [Thermodesulfobacteriota bacterium]